jgi:hypothetical protein
MFLLLLFLSLLLLLLLLRAGKMELFSASFYPAVQRVLDNPQLLVLGSVPVPRPGRTIPQVRPYTAVHVKRNAVLCVCLYCFACNAQ